MKNRNSKERVWEIKNGALVSIKNTDNKLAIEYWKHFKAMFPETITSKYIKKLVLNSDGLDGTMAALGPLNTKNTDWELVIDTLDINFSTHNKIVLYESVYSMIHEFGHLITLNNTQVKPVEKDYQEEGDPYLTEEGEAFKESYINLYVSEFWNGSLLEYWDKIKDKNYNQTKLEKKLFKFYQKNKEHFITDYAAESPEEDIAESWTHFVLNSKLSKPNKITTNKINFFYNFSSLVDIRKEIKNNIYKLYGTSFNKPEE
jgi:hypothetical protein